jgi:hypothetical protein
MLFRRDVLDAIRAGDITLAFRRWRKPSVRAGTKIRTAIGLIAIADVRISDPARITGPDARRAGYASRAALLAQLADRAGDIYRISLRFEGADPRIALRRAVPSVLEADAIAERLGRMDTARLAPWTYRVLSLIAERPGARAADLAAEVGRETRSFKADVRKLKELGLTESLDVGYRLSPRGQAVLRRLGGKS